MWSQQWCDKDISGFTEMYFIYNLRLSETLYNNLICFLFLLECIIVTFVTFQ